jgi:hypothetical protein
VSGELRLPDGGPLPLPYRWLHRSGARTLTPWHLIVEQKEALGLRREYLLEVGGASDWLPFARHQAQDDFAGFVLVDGVATGEVAVVHLTWAGKREQPGWPSMDRYQDGWEWIERCLWPETRDWTERNGIDDDE